VVPVLSALIELQRLDTATDAIRRRLAEHPAVEQTIARSVAAAKAELERVLATLATNQQSRRDLEKEVAAVDTRLARFENHKAAVKTNQEYTALLHEVATAKQEKDGLEERILLLLEEADTIATEISAAKARFQETEQRATEERAALAAERVTAETDAERLAAERSARAKDVDAQTLAKYEQLLKQRKHVAITRIEKEICLACHVRLRPAVTQVIRRNSEIVTCDSCQRILYFVPEPAAPAGEPAPPSHAG
jgi:predicted  nucleic acid-binding Zn-ribbon protein